MNQPCKKKQYSICDIEVNKSTIDQLQFLYYKHCQRCIEPSYLGFIAITKKEIYPYKILVYRDQVPYVEDFIWIHIMAN